MIDILEIEIWMDKTLLMYIDFLSTPRQNATGIQGNDQPKFQQGIRIHCHYYVYKFWNEAAS